MNRFAITLLVTFSVFAVSSAQTCPVTHLSASKPAAKSVYKGKSYSFCTTNCKKLFDKNPAKYVKKSKP